VEIRNRDGALLALTNPVYVGGEGAGGGEADGGATAGASG
jgi:hypothetical protein